MARAIQLQPEPDAILEARAIIAAQEQRLNEAGARDFELRRRYLDRAAELIEAKQMCGAGPWLVHEDRGKVNRPGRFKETSNPLLSQGAFSDMELALQNVEWRREVNLSWLEFSR
jgi:acyl-CoA reductase-like NAD-dependent aldehyde dehydrogenase